MDVDSKERLASREGTSEAPALVPPVDIVEDENGITLKADLPGVAKEDLSIGVDGENLTLEGTVNLGETRNMQAVYAEVRLSRYRRSFVLSRDLDTDKIEASMKNGVLNLHIPKREQAKPRRITVRAE